MHNGVDTKTWLILIDASARIWQHFRFPFHRNWAFANIFNEGTLRDDRHRLEVKHRWWTMHCRWPEKGLRRRARRPFQDGPRREWFSNVPGTLRMLLHPCRLACEDLSPWHLDKNRIRWHPATFINGLTWIHRINANLLRSQLKCDASRKLVDSSLR